MCIGLPPAGAPALGMPPNWYIGKNRRISGTLIGTMEDTRQALDFAKRGLLKQICEVYPVDKFPEAVDRLRKGLVAGRIVIDYNL
jgi:D-arabinose 1-dehydrogenase-like Zn-dependent alcohol dehydrogenase